VVVQGKSLGGNQPALRLPLSTIFKGEAQFHRLVQHAQKQRWDRRLIGERMALFGYAMTGNPCKGYTLEIDDRIESPSVNFIGLDCWTFFETAIGLARMLETPKRTYTPMDLLREIETTRYRAGACHGHYLDRLHYLADWCVDNDRRGTIDNLTAKLGGVPFRNRRISEMTALWKSYRYLRENPSLRPKMAQHERRVAQLPVTYIPKDRVERIESKLQNGDVIGIATKHNGGFFSHVGLAFRAKDGSMRLMHASSDKKKVIVDVPIHQYLARYSKNIGILVGRPQPVRQTSARRR
jgi:hypothetical protein